MATAFHRQTLTNTEGGTDQEQFRVEAIFDRVATTGTVWLGLTVGCAQCHTHKYDPITHQEYYQFFAFFNNADETQTDVPLVGDPLEAWQRDVTQAKEKLARLRPKLEKLRAERSAGVAAWEAELKASPTSPLAFHPMELVSAESQAGAEIKTLSDGSYLVSGQESRGRSADDHDPHGFARGHRAADRNAGSRFAWRRGPGRTEHGNFVLGEFRATSRTDGEFKAEEKVPFDNAEAEYHQNGFEPLSALDGKENTGWAIGEKMGQDHAIRSLPRQPIEDQDITLPAARAEPELWRSAYAGAVSRFRQSPAAIRSEGIPENIRDDPGHRRRAAHDRASDRADRVLRQSQTSKSRSSPARSPSSRSKRPRNP